MREEFACGALLSAPDVRDYVASAKTVDVPSEFELDMPKVKNQSIISSCVAHALSTVVEYFNQKETGSYEEMSTGYIYGNRRMTSHFDKGMYTRDAIKTVVKYGDVPNSYFPINTEVPHAIDKFEEHANELFDVGVQFKFTEYFRLNDDAAIKASILENGPAIMSMKWSSNVKVRGGIMMIDEDMASSNKGHCMVIYGWNDIGWKVQNSWGVMWGDGGRVIIPYDAPISQVWGVKDDHVCTNITIKKPFHSKTGVKIAKILNWIASIFYNIVNKNASKRG